jgi:hypothetical protein
MTLFDIVDFEVTVGPDRGSGGWTSRVPGLVDSTSRAARRLAAELNRIGATRRVSFPRC